MREDYVRIETMLIDGMDVIKTDECILRGTVQSEFLWSYFVSQGLPSLIPTPSIVLATATVLVTTHHTFVRSGLVAGSRLTERHKR
jgi:hypothetical protein